MANKTTPAPPAGPQISAAAAVEMYLRKMHRPERSHPGATLWSCLLYAAIALFPLLFALSVAASLPAPSGLTDAPVAAAPPHAAIGAMDAQIKAALDSYAANPPKADQDPAQQSVQIASTLETAKRIEALHARHLAANPPAGLRGAKGAHAAYTSYAAFAAATLIWGVLLCVALVSQIKLGWRQWDGVAQGPARDGYLSAIPLLAPALFAAGAAGFMWLLQAWVKPPPALAMPQHWLALHIAIGCAVAVCTLLFVSAFASMSAAHNYPSPMAARGLARAFGAARTHRAPGTTNAQVAIAYFQDRYQLAAGQPKGPAPRTITTDTPLPQSGAALHPDLAQGPLVNTRLTATQCLTIVRTVSTLAAVVMIVTLGMTSFGLGLLAPDASPLAADIKTSANAWVMLLGAGMSVSLFAIYGLPYLRLKPYADTETAAKPAARGWTLSGLLDKTNLALEAAPAKKKATPPDPIAPYETAMGANSAKLETILKGSTQGAAFHGLLEESLSAQILKLLGLLSPALAGGVLTLLG